MENIIGLITYGRGDFGVLAAHRPAYMLPFGCRYRLIDFALSTFSNNDIDNVALYAGSMLRSTIDHIGNGKPWDLNRRFGGLSIFPEVYSSKYNRSDELVNIYESLGFYESAVEEQIFFMDPMTITKIDVREVYRQHLTEDADMTLIYKTVDDKEGRYLNYDKMTLNDDGTVKNIGVNLGTQDVFNLYLGMGFIKKSVFLDLIKNALENDDSYSLKGAMLKEKGRYKIRTFGYNGRVAVIRDVNSYVDANMRLLDRDGFNEMFHVNGTILTKSKDEPSTIYHKNARVEHSLLANGCIIDGTITGSIIFRGVEIGKNAIIKNSIIMEGAIIEDDAVIINCVIDKGTIVKEAVSLVGSPTNPYTIGKKQVIKR